MLRQITKLLFILTKVIITVVKKERSALVLTLEAKPRWLLQFNPEAVGREINGEITNPIRQLSIYNRSWIVNIDSIAIKGNAV